eukprot:gene12617-14914_t
MVPAVSDTVDPSINLKRNSSAVSDSGAEEYSALHACDSRQSKRPCISNSVGSASVSASVGLEGYGEKMDLDPEPTAVETGGSALSPPSASIQPSQSICSVSTQDTEQDSGVCGGREIVLAKKEKAVKQKKTCLRVLKRLMDIPQNSPLLRVWRDAHVAKKSGKEITAGYYGIEVMDVEEVDNALQKLVPHIDVTLIGSQSPQVTTAGILGITPEIASKCVVMQKGRYHLKSEQFPAEARHMVRALKQRAKQLHHEAEEEQLRARGLSPAEGDEDHFDLRCFTCQGDLSCGCPVAIRRKLHAPGEDIENEASMIALLGCTFQEIWQRIAHLEPETLKEMVSKTCSLLTSVVEDVELKKLKGSANPEG